MPLPLQIDEATPASGLDFKPKKRIAGLNRGEILESDDFDAPLPDEFWLSGK